MLTKESGSSGQWRKPCGQGKSGTRYCGQLKAHFSLSKVAKDKYAGEGLMKNIIQNMSLEQQSMEEAVSCYGDA